MSIFSWLPGTMAASSLGLQTRQSLGQISPQSPIQGCPQRRRFWQDSLQKGLSQFSLHKLLHWKWGHDKAQGNRHGSQSSQQSFLHLSCTHDRWHGRVHGGHGSSQGARHRWEHTKVRPHGRWHFSWLPFSRHLPHTPPQACPHGSFVAQGAGHSTSSENWKHSTITEWRHCSFFGTFMWHWNWSHGTPHSPGQMCPHDSGRWHLCLHLAFMETLHGRPFLTLCPQGNCTFTRIVHLDGSHGSPQKPWQVWLHGNNLKREQIDSSLL